MSVLTSIFDSALTTLLAIKNYLGGDGKTNAEPVHNSETDLDADDWNRVVAGLAEVVEAVKALHAQCLSATAVKTADYAADFGELVLVDLYAATGNVTITLPPTSSVDKDKVAAVKIVALDSGELNNMCYVAAATGEYLEGGTWTIKTAHTYECVVFSVVSAAHWAVVAQADGNFPEA